MPRFIRVQDSHFSPKVDITLTDNSLPRILQQVYDDINDREIGGILTSKYGATLEASLAVATAGDTIVVFQSTLPGWERHVWKRH